MKMEDSVDDWGGNEDEEWKQWRQVAGEGFVHLDLKGAPLSVDYLKKVFPLFKKWGATGVIIEYEDTFPYDGEVKRLAAPHAYSADDITEILDTANSYNLLVMPLVQTLGHLEFVLKYEEFSGLREMDLYPMALCPCNPDSITVLQTMIDQVFRLHPGVNYFHIGCDEVYHLGLCNKCTVFMTSNSMRKEHLFFYHVKRVASYIKEKYAHVTCIVWDDMLRFAETSVILECGLENLVEPMVWHYLPSFMLPQDIWDKLSAVFSTVWIASAFKGASGPRANFTNISYHLDNHMAWLELLHIIRNKFKSIKGVAITGWARYDHFATLCELLPHAIPSLALCLKLVQNQALSQDDIMAVSKELGFLNPLPLNPLTSQVPVCSFPGSDVYCVTIEFAQVDMACREFFASEYLATWMNDYNVARGFVNPIHVEPLLNKSLQFLSLLKTVDSKCESSFRHVFLSTVVLDEWRAVNIVPLLSKLEDFISKSRNIIVTKSSNH